MESFASTTDALGVRKMKNAVNSPRFARRESVSRAVAQARAVGEVRFAKTTAAPPAPATPNVDPVSCVCKALARREIAIPMQIALGGKFAKTTCVWRALQPSTVEKVTLAAAVFVSLSLRSLASKQAIVRVVWSVMTASAMNRVPQA